MTMGGGYLIFTCLIMHNNNLPASFFLRRRLDKNLVTSKKTS